MELDNLYDNNGICRTAVYIKQNIIFNRLKHIENSGESIIALNIGYPNKKKINVIGYYRQWSDVYNHKIFKKHTIAQQNEKFENQLNKINQLLENNKETIIMGDFNFDFRAINKDENQKTQHETKFNQMYKKIKKKKKF